MRDYRIHCIVATPMDELYCFDIYQVEAGGKVLLESVMGMFRAKQRMTHFAGKKPGRYYVWDNNGRQILYEIDTRNKRRKNGAA